MAQPQLRLSTKWRNQTHPWVQKDGEMAQELLIGEIFKREGTDNKIRAAQFKSMKTGKVVPVVFTVKGKTVVIAAKAVSGGAAPSPDEVEQIMTTMVKRYGKRAEIVIAIGDSDAAARNAMEIAVNEVLQTDNQSEADGMLAAVSTLLTTYALRREFKTAYEKSRAEFMENNPGAEPFVVRLLHYLNGDRIFTSQLAYKAAKAESLRDKWFWFIGEQVFKFDPKGRDFLIEVTLDEMKADVEANAAKGSAA
jgi:hypothetical protein